MRVAVRRAAARFHAHPYVGNCLLGVTVGTTGDAIAQHCFPGPETRLERLPRPGSPEPRLDWNRMAAVAGFSAVVYPILTRWYIFTEALCGPAVTVGKALAQKLALDEFVWAPLVNSGYLLCSAFRRGESITEELREKLPAVMLADWAVWPCAMTVGFLKVPVQYRPGYVALVGVAWNTFLSYKAHYYYEHQKPCEIKRENELEREDAVDPVSTRNAHARHPTLM